MDDTLESLRQERETLRAALTQAQRETQLERDACTRLEAKLHQQYQTLGLERQQHHEQLLAARHVERVRLRRESPGLTAEEQQLFAEGLERVRQGYSLGKKAGAAFGELAHRAVSDAAARTREVQSGPRLLGCVWCDWQVPAPQDLAQQEDLLVEHTLSKCREHPMRTLEHGAVQASLALKQCSTGLILVAKHAQEGSGPSLTEELLRYVERLKLVAEALLPPTLELSPVPTLVDQVAALRPIVEDAASVDCEYRPDNCGGECATCLARKALLRAFPVASTG